MGKPKKLYQPAIEWQTIQVRLGDLVEWAKNPRQLSTKDGKQLEKGMAKFGLADPLIVNADGKSLIGGHQRRRILLSKHGPDIQVDVRVPSRSLDTAELEELAIRLNRNVGDWDMDLLANGFDVDTLLEWGFEENDLDLNLWLPEPKEDPGAQMDKAEELRVKWQTALGQLWGMGKYTVCPKCGKVHNMD